MRPLISLYVLLTTPVPLPRALFVRAVAILSAYGAFAPYGDLLADFYLSPVKLSVVIGLLAGILWNAAAAFRNLENHSDGKNPRAIHLVAGVLIVACLLAPSDLWLGYLVAAGYAGFGGLVLSLGKGDPQFFARVNGLTLERPKVVGNTIIWLFWRYIWCAVALLALARHTVGLEWIIGYATIPIAFYYLYWWTIVATAPLEDGSQQD